MNGNPDGLSILERRSLYPFLSLRYIPDANENLVSTIEYGILFLMAFWSVPAVSAFAKLTKAIHDMAAGEIEVVVVDVDGSPDFYQLPDIRTLYGGLVTVPEGKVEAAFCRDGKIVFATVLGFGDDVNQYYFNARKFLSANGVSKPRN